MRLAFAPTYLNLGYCLKKSPFTYSTLGQGARGDESGGAGFRKLYRKQQLVVRGVASPHRIVYSSLSELVLGSFLLLALDLNLRLLLIELHELGQIELGLLEQLDLSNEDVLEREDLLAFLSDGLANRVLDAKQQNILGLKI